MSAYISNYGLEPVVNAIKNKTDNIYKTLSENNNIKNIRSSIKSYTNYYTFNNYYKKHCNTLLDRLTKNDDVLFVGNGAENALYDCSEKIKEKNLKIDYVNITNENDYNIFFNNNSKTNFLTNNYRSYKLNITEKNINSIEGSNKYTKIIFFNCISTENNYIECINKAKDLLKSSGEFIIILNLEIKEQSIIKKYIKPNIKHIIGCDFGKNIEYNNFFTSLLENKIKVKNSEIIEHYNYPIYGDTFLFLINAK